MDNFSKIVVNLFDNWEQNNIVYCHWKSIDHLEATYLAQTDIDVLVERDDTERAKNLVLKLGFIEVKSSHFRGYPSVRDFVCYDSILDRWVHLHFHSQLSCGDRWVKAYHLPFEKLILSHRIWLNQYQTWVIAPSYELLILIFRMNAKFKKNWLKDKKILIEIQSIVELNMLHAVSIDRDLVNFIGADNFGIFESILKGKLISDFQISKIRKGFDIKEFRRMSGRRFFFVSKLRYSYRIYSEVKKRYFKIFKSGRRSFPKGGFVIAFVGIDGSGKTSGIERITKFFAQQMNVQTNFLGSGKSGAGFVRKMIMNVMGFKASSKEHKEARKAGQTKREDVTSLKVPPIQYVLWIWLCTLDREKQLKKIQYGLGNGNLVFVDRWLQDNRLDSVDSPRLSNFIGFKGLVGLVARREAKIYKKIKLIPLHQVVKLNITPENSVERKPGELTLEQAKNAIEKLNVLQWPENTKIVDVDGTDNLQNVTINLKKAVFQLLQTKQTD